MSLITDIKPQKNLRHGEPRFNIYLDGKFSFAVPAEVLAKAGLKIQQQLTQENIQKLIKENELDKYYNLALQFLSFRPRSEKELKDWFRKKEVGEDTQKVIWEKLKHLGYINDEEFIKWWVDQRQTFKPRGKRALEMELWQKGISKDLVSKYLSVTVSSLSELDLAKKAAEKKIKLWEKLPPLEFRQKITAFLARRGFSWEIIDKIIDEIGQKE
ncbi:MAG: RecX family transcriptional regulator [Candidatus Gottesmanbacteria bacterium]